MTRDHGNHHFVKTSPPRTSLENNFDIITKYLKDDEDRYYERVFDGKYGAQMLSIRWLPDQKVMQVEHFEPDPNAATDEPPPHWASCGIVGRSEHFTGALKQLIKARIALRTGDEVEYIFQ